LQASLQDLATENTITQLEFRGQQVRKAELAKVLQSSVELYQSVFVPTYPRDVDVKMAHFVALPDRYCAAHNILPFAAAVKRLLRLARVICCSAQLLK
jgi:hypothetical protein